MYRILIGLLLAVPAAGLAADPPADGKADAKSTLTPGSNLPGTILPYNVTGPYKGRFHCLISDYGLEPVVLIFARDLEATPALKDLLESLRPRSCSCPFSAAPRLVPVQLFLCRRSLCNRVAPGALLLLGSGRCLLRESVLPEKPLISQLEYRVFLRNPATSRLQVSSV